MPYLSSGFHELSCHDLHLPLIFPGHYLYRPHTFAPVSPPLSLNSLFASGAPQVLKFRSSSLTVARHLFTMSCNPTSKATQITSRYSRPLKGIHHCYLITDTTSISTPNGPTSVVHPTGTSYHMSMLFNSPGSTPLSSII